MVATPTGDLLTGAARHALRWGQVAMALTLFALFAVPAYAGPTSASSPFYLSHACASDVRLLMDNSGSMATAIRPSAYGPSLKYPDSGSGGYPPVLFGHDLDITAGTSKPAAANRKQHLRTFTVGFTADNPMLQDTAHCGGGQHFNAGNADELSRALNSTIPDPTRRTSSAAALAATSTTLHAGTTLYQATFFGGDWSGDLRAFALDATGTVPGSPAWNAASGIPAPETRNIATYSAGTGAAFRWADLTASEQADLNGTDRAGEARLQYLRGSRAHEAPRGPFRTRNPQTVLGDIVHSNPLFVHAQDYGYSALPDAAGRTYYRYLRGRQSHKGVVYVGANDGMLHAFDGSTGRELFAYVPRALYAKLPALTATGYGSEHEYYVDGSPTASDAFINGHWGTYLLGALGAGGRGIFALDITDPARLGPDSVLWSFSAFTEQAATTTTPCHYHASGRNCSGIVSRDLGFTIPGATVTRMTNGEWVALIPNGYDSPSGKATLFIVDLATGNLVRELVADSGPDNGLSGVAAIDYNGDRSVDYIYGGDLKGNLWKFNVSSTNPGNWRVAYGHPWNPQPLFTACTNASCADRQPITMQPAVARDPDGGLIVVFGTGRPFAVGDNTVAGNSPTQSLYGIRDVRPAATGGTPIARTNLLRQTLTAPVSSPVAGYAVRTSTAKPIAPAQAGWYLDLGRNGERLVGSTVIHNHRVAFTTLVPNPGSGGAGGDTYLFALNAFSGSRLANAPFDLNGDGQSTTAGQPTLNGATGRPTQTAVSGIQSPAFMLQAPLTVSASGRQVRFGSSMAGTLIKLPASPGAAPRQSWVQLR